MQRIEDCSDGYAMLPHARRVFFFFRRQGGYDGDMGVS